MARRLAAILAADAVAYSRLIRADEEGTLDRFKALCNEIIDPKVTEHNGRVVKLMGDGMLVEFASVVDAVRAAIEAQLSITEYNAGLPEETRIEFRMGINLGDVVIDGDDIHGDGVNVAARLEGLAEPGGVCVSDAVYGQVRDRIEFRFADLGEKDIKNIDRPLRVWRWMPKGTIAKDSGKTDGPRSLADKPSLAVLPFTNMSGDPEQEYFADGIAEDITTALSRFHELTVIARNTSFTFKGQAVNVKEIAHGLGVKYILEGSVRRAANRVRVTVQLIDASLDSHLWAERYDREIDDIFAVQDEITESIVAAVAPETRYAEMASAYRKEAIDLTSWEQVMRARWHLDKFTRKDTEIAEGLLAEAIENAPHLAQAYSTQAVCHVYRMLNAWCDDPSAEIAAAGESARRAVALDANDADALAVMGLAALMARQFDECLELLHRAAARNPNLANAYGFMATAYGCMGECEKALNAFDKALALSPRDHTRLLWMSGKGIALYLEGRYDEAAENARIMMRIDPSYGAAHRQLCASLAMAGRLDEARSAMVQLQDRMPNLTVAKVSEMIPVRRPADTQRWLDGLRLAGLPNG